MAQAKHLFLAGVRHRAGADNAADIVQQVFFGGPADLVFQFIGNIEVVFDGALAAA